MDVELQGDTALTIGADRGNKEVVQLLLDHRATVDHANQSVSGEKGGEGRKRGKAGKGKEEEEEARRRRTDGDGVTGEKGGMNVRGTDVELQGETALTLAAREGHKDVVQLLLEHHVTVDHATQDVSGEKGGEERRETGMRKRRRTKGGDEGLTATGWKGD